MTILMLVVSIFHSEPHWTISLSSTSQIYDSRFLIPHHSSNVCKAILIKKLSNRSIRVTGDFNVKGKQSPLAVEAMKLSECPKKLNVCMYMHVQIVAMFTAYLHGFVGLKNNNNNDNDDTDNAHASLLN